MFDFKKDWWKILLIVIAILVIIVAIILIIKYFRKPKETYITATNSKISDKNTTSNDPLQKYVNSWITSVQALYSNAKKDGYVEARPMKNFQSYTYLDKDSIITGVKKY